MVMETAADGWYYMCGARRERWSVKRRSGRLRFTDGTEGSGIRRGWRSDSRGACCRGCGRADWRAGASRGKSAPHDLPAIEADYPYLKNSSPPLTSPVSPNIIPYIVRARDYATFVHTQITLYCAMWVRIKA